ncbi:MAG TPA: YqaE/Pmp3 family membrane protein [Alphaproteobacteria bacterium]|nr:YqaE/Pmp3 family membrane protein [Alphaproteobacteria bacterium]
MRYVLAIILPPLAVLFCGKPIQFILNIFLTLLGWIPGAVHAILVVNSHLADKRTDRIVNAMKNK